MAIAAAAGSALRTRSQPPPAAGPAPWGSAGPGSRPGWASCGQHLPLSKRRRISEAPGATALKQETYNLIDLKHDPYCAGLAELGDSASVS